MEKSNITIRLEKKEEHQKVENLVRESFWRRQMFLRLFLFSDFTVNVIFRYTINLRIHF